MANQNMKRYLALLIIKEMQIKTTVNKQQHCKCCMEGNAGARELDSN